MFDLKIKFISSKAIIPSYAHENDAGLDLFSIENQRLHPGESLLIRTGIIIELPKNTEAQIRPRSGLALKHQVTVLNTPGTIDSNYRGEIGVILINHGKNVFKIEEGMRIAQMVVKPILKINVVCDDMLSATQRGDKGFGSSGYK